MKSRIYFLDNLRTFLIFLVVVLHAGLVYEPVLQNSWIVVDHVQNNSIGLIRMYLDVFVMFCIFFISGYFIPFSIKNKSSRTFIVSKLKRLMLPWLIAVLTLIPAYKAIFLFSRGLPQEEWFSYFHFYERTGTDLTFFANNPAQNWLWFLPVLFVFQMLYYALSKLNLKSLKLSVKTGVILTLIIGVVYSMIISYSGMKGWTHNAIFHFQNERLLVYFMSFLLGALCNRNKVFESNSKKTKMYIWANVALAVAMTVFTIVTINLFYNIIDPSRNYYFVSEFVDKLAHYTSLVSLMLSFLYILIHTFRFNFNKTNTLLNELNRNSYSVYIIHTIVLGIIAVAFLKLQAPAFVKYIFLSVTTFLVSNLLIYSYRAALQKKVNLKMAATAVFAVFIVATAFKGIPQTKAPQSAMKTETQKQVPSTGLHEAVITGNLEAVQNHIIAGSDLNEKEPAGGSSALITACVFGKTEIALALIEEGADVNQTNNEGSTALHTAAFFCRTEIVQSLLENGIDKNVKNNAGSTALESVQVPFEMVKGIYEYFAKTYEPLGLNLDMERLKNTRSVVAEMLNK